MGLAVGQGGKAPMAPHGEERVSRRSARCESNEDLFGVSGGPAR